MAFAPAPTVTGTTVRESCYEVQLNFRRTGATTFADTAYVTLSGTSTSGEDYTDIPVQVIFAAGVNTVSFPVTFPQDADGQETPDHHLGRRFPFATMDSPSSASPLPSHKPQRSRPSGVISSTPGGGVALLDLMRDVADHLPSGKVEQLPEPDG